MARGKQRKTVREVVEGPNVRQPIIQDHTRFINARGSRSGEGAARALEAAFGVGQQIAADQAIKRNEEGFARAIGERASGVERSADDENFGYNVAWDRLDAEYDFNLIKQELPELLRGFDSENKSEAEVQQFITDYYQEQLGGVEALGESEYAKALAPALLEFETSLIADHRQAQIEGIREEQRTKLYSNFVTKFNETGEADYDKLFNETGVFFEGSDKKTIFWETLADVAITEGRPELLENVPSHINGVMTGSNDPEFQDELRANIQSATATAARRAAAAQAEAKAANERMLFASQYGVAQTLSQGGDPRGLIEEMRLNPEADAAAIQAALSLGETFADLSDDLVQNDDYINTAWRAIHTQEIPAGSLGTQITQAYSMGLLGGGKAAETRYNQMMNAIDSYINGDTADILTSEDANLYRSDLNRHYDKTLGGPTPDGFIARTNAAAHARYNALLLEGKSPLDASQTTKTEFDQIVENAPLADIKSLSSKTSLREYYRDFVVTAENVQRVLDGHATFGVVFGGIAPDQLETILLEHANAGNLTEDQINRLFE